MDDLQIITALMNGNHLEPKDRQRAKQVIHSLSVALKQRV